MDGTVIALYLYESNINFRNGIMRLLTIIFTILLLTTNSTFAAEAAHVTNQRFMPLAPRTAGSTVQHPLVTQPTRFLPLTQSRFPMPVRQANSVASELPEKPTSGKKTDMSQEQAKQLLSIFAEAQ